MSKERVPIRAGYFTEEKDDVHLLATRCKSCGQIYFPPLQRCMECYQQDMEEVKLSRQGKLYTYTIVQMPVLHYKPPFALAWVELPQGVRVFTQLKNWENTELKIGMDVNLVIDTLWEEEAKEVYGYKFEPVI
jgi:uncharacterized OB-fold protein